MKPVIFPSSLKPGDQIAIVSPAGAVSASQLESGLAMICDHGFEPVLGAHLYTNYRHGYDYAGTEEQRIEDLRWALGDPNIGAVWASRGGYGCQHLLKHLDLTSFKNKPKWYIGYSDNTALQSFLCVHGYASIHGQTLKTSSFGVSEESYQLIFDVMEGKKPDYHIDSHPLNKKGRATGQLIGGNLALMYALLGTPYSFKFENNILFIEDIGEQYYALDRMLMSLELAGVFDVISGLIIGGMTQMGEEKSNEGYMDSFDALSYEIIAERVQRYSFPVAFAFPNGHVYDNRPLIIGAQTMLNVTESVQVCFK